MSHKVIERGRGPEIAGTRVTVSRVMDCLSNKMPADGIARELDLTVEEVQSALAYIESHRAEVDAAYEALLQHRETQRALVAASCPSSDDLKRRIERRAATPTHAGPS